MHLEPSASSGRFDFDTRQLRLVLLLIGVLVLFGAARWAPKALAVERFGSELKSPQIWDPGSTNGPRGVAVSQKEGGDVYVIDGGSTQRVDVFTPDGTFVRAFGWGIVPGAASGTGNLTAGSALVGDVVTTSGQFSQSGAEGKFISGPGIQPGTRVEIIRPNVMQLTKPATETASHVPLTATAAPGNVPANERQELTVRATGGQFELTFISPRPDTSTQTTAPLGATATAAEVQSALEALSNVGAGSVAVTGGPGDAEGSTPYLIEFKGRFADTNVRKMSVVEIGLSGGVPSSRAAVATRAEGGGAVETCTTVCGPPSDEEDTQESGEGFGGSAPGQFNTADEIAVDNDPLSPSYGDVYVVDQRNFRVEKFGPEGEFLLIFGGEVDKTTHGDVCTAAELAGGDLCGAGVPGTGPSHFYKEEPSLLGRSWANDGSSSIAVGPDGTVYVGDYGRIEKFEPDGAYSGEIDLNEAEPNFVTSLTLDPAGNIYERSVNYKNLSVQIESEVPGVRELDPSGTLLKTFDTESGSDPTHVALDEKGNVYISEPKESQAGTPPTGVERFSFKAGIRVFEPSGTLIAELTSTQIENNESKNGNSFSLVGNNPLGLAVGDAAGDLYGSSNAPKGTHIAVLSLPESGPPTVGGETVSDVAPEAAILHAVVNPREFETSYRFEYVDDAHFQSEGFAGPATQETTTVPLGRVERDDAVKATIASLSPATKYDFRTVAESSRNGGETVVGPAQSFETLPSVSVRKFITQTVGAEVVKFSFELNPNNSLQPTHYVLHYGPAENDYTRGAAEGSIAGASGEFVPREATFTGLTPNTTYHYQLTAENEFGSIATSDRTLTTEPSAAEERQAEDCPNGSDHGALRSTLREENNSLALPDCRAYEQVSEVHKGAGQVFATASLAPSGERVLYSSEGVFDGALVNEFSIQYLAHRTASGWVTQPVIGHPAEEPNVQATTTPNELDFSPELDRWLFGEVPGFDQNEAFHQTKSLYLSIGEADGSYILHASPEIHLVEGPERDWFSILPLHMNGFQSYTADNLSRLYFKSSSRLLPAPEDTRPDPWGQGRHPSPSNDADRIYEIAGLGGPDPVLSLVAEVPDGLPLLQPGGSLSTGCKVDGETNGDIFENQTARLLSSDGTTMVYSVPLELEAGEECGNGKPNPIGLFAHHSGENGGFQINVPPPGQCHSPNPCASSLMTEPKFAGLSPDGSRAWFVTNQSLVDSDTDGGGDLYLAKLGSGGVEELVQASAGEATASHPVAGEGAGVIGALRVSSDGSRVAFLATGVLTEDKNSLGESAAPGARNLYVYNAEDESIRFVAQLGPEDVVGVKPAYVFSSDGRYLVFQTKTPLTPDDTDKANDVYRYDSRTGDLTRLSFGRDGNDGNGNSEGTEGEATLPHGELSEPNSLAEDSSRGVGAGAAVVVFETTAPLVSKDTNEALDVYEWEEEGHGTCTQDESGSGGCVRLISDGLDPHGAVNAIVSSSGADITFHTHRNEVPADTDGVGDIYDARVDGGFHFTPPPEQCRSTETCHGAGTGEELHPSYTSEQFAGSGNGEQRLQCGKGRHRVTKHGQARCVANKHRKHRKKHHKHSGGKRSVAHRQGGSR